MTDSLESVKDSKTALGVGAGSLLVVSSYVAAFLLSRGHGLVRALSVGFKSYFKTSHPLSIRASEVKLLSDSLLTMEEGSFYIVVTGRKGNGKTCLIDTALNRHLGVVKITVSCLLDSLVVHTTVS